MDPTVPSRYLLFHAFLYIPLAFPDLNTIVADVISSESFNLNLTFIPFLRLVLTIAD